MTSPERLLHAETIWELVEERAALTPDRAALYDERGTELSFAALRDGAAEAARRLAALGIGPGSRVAWLLPTRISTALSMLGLARIGAFQAPLIHLYRERELSALIPAVRAEYLLTPGVWRDFDYPALARGVAPGLPVTSVGPDGIDGDAAALPSAPKDGREVRWAYSTSGSSGTPKAAQHTDQTLLTAAHGFALHGRLGERDDEVGAIPFPIGHVGGIVYLLSMLAAGFPAVVVEAFDPVSSTALFRDRAVTTLGGSPVFYQALLHVQRAAKEPVLPSLRLLKGGGAPLTESLYRTLREELRIQVAHDYGMTESPMIGVADPADPDDVLARTDGRVIPGLSVRITGPGDRPVPDGTEGEIQIRGGCVTPGYTDPARTAEAFTEDGWFRTGDLGRLGPDGHITVTGRLKDVIIRKGENISPVEVEEALQTHPGIAEVAVVGLPDEERGELACAVVRLRAPAAGLTLDDLRAHLSEAGLMRQKFPERLEIVDEIPQMGLGKVDKAALRARFSAS